MGRWSVLYSSGVLGGVLSGYVSLAPSSTVSLDLATGQTFQLEMDGTSMTFDPPTRSGATPAAGDRIWIYLDQDGTGDRAAPAFTGGAGGFASDVESQMPDGTPSTRSIYQLCFDGARWILEAFRTGGAIT